eukprot:s3803_g4.t1
MAVSIQYMQRPVDLLREAFRVLKPGGVLIVSFSNRMFFTKAIEVWRSQRNMKGLVNLVLNYFRESGFEDVRAANRVQTDNQATGWLSSSGDPFAAVVSVKQQELDAGEIWERSKGISWLDMNEAGVKAQQAKLLPHLSGHGDGVPRFTHAISLRNNVVSEALLQGVDCHAPLREFGFENISAVLPSLFTAMCGREKPLPVERIRVEPKWVTSRYARKRFKKRPQSWLDGIQAAMIRSERFVEIVSAGTSFPRSEIERMSPKDFADALTGVALEEPFPVEVERLHPPHMQYLCFPSRRAFQNPPEDPTQNLYVPLPLDEETRNELQLQKLSFVMCNLRQQLQLQARPDEWPDSSKPLWCGKGSELRFVRPGDEMDAVIEAEHLRDDESAPVRFHWRPDLRLGSPAACAMIAEDLLPDEPSFADNFLHEALKSLLHEDSTVQELDLRGNGLTKHDVTFGEMRTDAMAVPMGEAAKEVPVPGEILFELNLLLDLVSSHRSLVRLNQIPVLEEEAATCPTLVIDGTGMKLPEKQAGFH